MLPELIKLFQRDLDTLKKEIQSFREEGDLWRTTGSIKNPAGNLCLHLVGNLNNYIGKNIGGTGYVRDRDAEFVSFCCTCSLIFLTTWARSTT